MLTPHVCNQPLHYHAWSRYRLRSTPVVPWIVTISALHGVRDVLFPRSCFLTCNRFLSLVKWLHDTLKITIGYKCTCADDTRTTTTTEILYIRRLTPMKCPHYKLKFKKIKLTTFSYELFRKTPEGRMATFGVQGSGFCFSLLGCTKSDFLGLNCRTTSCNISLKKSIY